MKALVFFLLIVVGVSASGTDVLKKVEEKYKGIETLSMDFSQKITYSSTGQKTTFDGRILLARPNRMRMSVTEPDTQLLVSSGDSLWIYLKSANQVFLYDLKEESFPQVGTLIFGMSKEFMSQLLAKTRDSYVLKLKPLEESKYYDSLHVRVSRKSLLIGGLTIFDRQANRIEYTFTKTKTNPEIGESQFRFEPPPGVDVIKHR
jgi:outer membrane lipoprotein carrier protein